MSQPLAPPTTAIEAYLAAILSEIQAGNEMLAELLAQVTPPLLPAPPGEVPLREPAPARRGKRSK